MGERYHRFWRKYDTDDSQNNLRRSHHRDVRLYSDASAETGASFGKAGKPHLARGGAAAAHQPQATSGITERR
jgi:hypothetical protein